MRNPEASPVESVPSEHPAIRVAGLIRTRRGGSGDRNILDGLDLEVCRGEIVAVAGPSGCGKSTLLGVVGGLDRDFQGEVEVAGRSYRAATDAELSRLRATTVGFVFQDYSLLEGSSCQENVELPRLMSDPGPPRVARRHALELLDRVGLKGLECEDVASLSGGERQRVAIARALVNSPSILLCDEPTGNLDHGTAHVVLQLLLELRRERQLTVVVATHDPDLEEMADRVLDLADGRLQERSR